MGLRAIQPEAGETEIVERRTVFSKAFRRPDGKIRVAAKVGPQHFPDNGQMVEIDDEPESADGLRWAARRVPYVLDWDADTVTLIYASKRGGGMRIRLLALDGVAFTKAIEAPRRVGNRIFVKVHAELEIELRIKAAGIEIFKRLLGPTSPTTLRWEIIEGDMTHIRYDPLKILAHDNMLGLVSRPNDMLPRRRAECLVTKGPVTNLADGRIRYTVTERITGFTWQINEQTSSRTKLNEIAYPVVIDVTVTEDITDTADDGTGSLTTWYTTNYTYTSTSGQRMAAWRWVTVDVPQGQTLDSATFSVNVTTNASTGGCVLKGQNVDSADAWALSSSNTPVTMAATTASASFAPSGTGVKTLDVTSIVQEIINRAGWAANNNIRLGTTSPFSGGSVIFEDSQAAGTDEGQLTIVYTAGGGQPAMKRWAGVPGMGQTNSIGRGW